MRPIMTSDELRTHIVDEHGRDYSKSDDGYSDMEVEEREGKWRAISGWGRDGWDLGDWPFVMIYKRDTVEVFGLERPGQFYPATEERLAELRERDADFFEVTYEMQTVVEGDRTVYSFKSPEDRDAGIDYLFIWYAIRKEYDEFTTEGLTAEWNDETHEYTAITALNAGTLRVPEHLRGPFSWARLDKEKPKV